MSCWAGSGGGGRGGSNLTSYPPPSFCKECGFDALKASTFLSIAKVTCNLIRSEAGIDMPTAFEKFKQLVFAHAVDRSPHAVLIFSLEDVGKVGGWGVGSADGQAPCSHSVPPPNPPPR